MCNEADIILGIIKNLKGPKTTQITCPNPLVSTPSTPAMYITTNRPEDVVPLITPEKITKACCRIHDNKAPGHDGIPNKEHKTCPNIARIHRRRYVSCSPRGIGIRRSINPIFFLLATIGKKLKNIFYNQLSQIVLT